MQGSGGGPSESNVSGYLVRSTSTKWANNSVLAVDAGTHLSGIIRILETHQLTTSMNPPSSPSTPSDGAASQAFPFSGAPLPTDAPKANAAFIVRELVSTYLLTHAHLDHLSGFVINSAAFSPKNKPKCLAALPGVINAVKTHIFNDVIWPNLSDEDSGIGLFKYQRLSAAEDYVPVSEGLSAQAWPVSHGHCMKRHTHWGRKSTINMDDCDRHENHLGDRQTHQKWCVLDSAVFFIRDDATGKEVMMWGDVEPDSISLDPRNDRVWQEAALKIFQGKLGSIFIECSYDRSQPDEHLYGHLSPVHMMTELALLAEGVEALRHKERSERLKRKRQPSNDDLLEEHGRTSPRPAKRRSEGDIFSESLCPRTPPPFTNMRRESNVSPRSTPLPSISAPPPIITTTTTTTDFRKDWVQPLKGLQIVVTHVKDTMSGEDIPSKVLADLEALEEKEKLGVTFLMAEQGLGLYL